MLTLNLASNGFWFVYEVLSFWYLFWSANKVLAYDALFIPLEAAGACALAACMGYVDGVVPLYPLGFSIAAVASLVQAGTMGLRIRAALQEKTHSQPA